MKKMLTILLAGLTAASLLASCGSEGNTSSTASGSSETSSESSAASSEDSAASGETTGEATNRLEEIKQKGVIVLATSPDFAPQEFEDISSGEKTYVGCDIELAKYIADYIGVELDIQAMDFQACQAAVSTGKADFSISGYAWKEDRAENYEISDFFNVDRDEDGSRQVVIVPADKASEYQSPEDFAGKTIGCQNGSLQLSLTETQLPDAEVKLIDTLGSAVLMVQNNKIDALACSGDQADIYVEKNSALALADWEFDYTSQGNIALIMKGETELAAAINEAIAEVNEQGLYQQWKDEATELALSLGIDVN